MVTLLQSRRAKPVPHILPIHRPRHLQRDLQIPTLDRKIESGLLVLDKVERNLGIPLLLKVGDNALTDEVRVPDDLEDLIVVFAGERELEAVLGRVDGDGPRGSGSVEAVHDLALDAGEVDGLLEGLDDTVVTAGQLGPAVLRRGKLTLEEGRI